MEFPYSSARPRSASSRRSAHPRVRARPLPTIQVRSSATIDLSSSVGIRANREIGATVSKKSTKTRAKQRSTTQSRARRATSPKRNPTSRPHDEVGTTPRARPSPAGSAVEELAAAAAAAYLSKAAPTPASALAQAPPAPAIAEKAMPTKPSGTERVARPLGDDESTAATELAAPGGGCAEAFTQIEPQGLAATYWGESPEVTSDLSILFRGARNSPGSEPERFERVTPRQRCSSGGTLRGDCENPRNRHW